MNGSRTHICHICGFSARAIINSEPRLCPEHNVPMVNIGSKWRIPKKGSKAMKLFLAAMKKDSELNDTEHNGMYRLNWRKVPFTDKHGHVLDKPEIL